MVRLSVLQQQAAVRIRFPFGVDLQFRGKKHRRSSINCKAWNYRVRMYVGFAATSIIVPLHAFESMRRRWAGADCFGLGVLLMPPIPRLYSHTMRSKVAANPKIIDHAPFNNKVDPQHDSWGEPNRIATLSVVLEYIHEQRCHEETNS